MKKVRTSLFMLMTFIALTGCKVIDSSSGNSQSDAQSESHSASQSESQSESEASSINTKGEKVEIKAAVILDYGKLTANKVTPILDREVDLDVSKEIATAVYGDEVIISYFEDEEDDYTVEIIEKELLENITVFMNIAPGAQEGDFECYTSEIGIVFNISRIEDIINLDGSYIGKGEWSKLIDTPLYASYNPEESKQTTEFTTLHYLTALYSYNPRAVE